MSEEKELSFTGINYSVCTYCKYRVGAPHRDGWNEGCGKRYVPGKGFARLTISGDVKLLKEKYNVDAVNEFVGCDQFESSGLPIHPFVLEKIVSRNPLLRTISVDEKATETSWDLAEKAIKLLPQESFYKNLDDIQ